MSEVTTPTVSTDTGSVSASQPRAIVKTDFDDLLSAYDEVAEGAEEQPKTEAPKQQTTATPPAERQVKAPAEEKPEEVAEEQAPPKNIIKAKDGEAEVDIPEDAVVEREINGKKVQFKVGEAMKALVNQETFNRNMDSRLSHLHAKETTFMKRVDQMQQHLAQLTQRAQDGDLFGLFQFSAEFAKKDPVEFEQEMLEKFRQIYSKYENLTPDQKKALFAEKKAAFLAKKLQEHHSTAATEQAKLELASQVDRRCQEAGIDREVFDGLFFNLVKTFVEGKQPFNKRQLNSAEDVTVDDVFLYKNRLDMIDKVERAVQTVAPDRHQPEFIARILNVVGDDFDLTAEDISELLSSGAISLKTPAQENLAQRSQTLEKRGFGAQTTKRQASSNNKQSTEIDDELYKQFFRRR